MFMQEIRVDARDGHALSARTYQPVEAPRRAMLIAGAMGVPQRFYEGFATWLADQGVAVITFDWRGVGASAPPSLRGFKASITDWATQDLPAMVDELRQRWPGLPATYLGHSLGGQLFGWLDNASVFDRVLTVAAGNGYWRLNAKAVRSRAPLLWWVLAPIGIALAGYFPGKRLKVIDDVPAAAMWQWRKWCLHPDYLACEGPEMVARYASVSTPIRAIVMDDDELLSPAGVRDLYRLYSTAPVTFESPAPAAFGLKRIGHFGFFKSSGTPSKGMTDLWAHALPWIDA